ncbi:hypothetical protein GGI07_001304 [Coemansia sp. Benny D115]|nr:hypothetical protein GGI07_001304 [Coemansia sp. Benny D115]
MVQPPIRPKIRFNVGGYSAETARAWAGSGARWGAFAGLAALFLVSQVPIMKKEILQNTPVLGWYWKVDEPTKDK